MMPALSLCLRNRYYGIHVSGCRDRAATAGPMQERKQEYLDAYKAWQTQLQALHHVLLDGERLEPPKLKALLNREARMKERYDRARRALLGLSEEG